MSVFSDEWRRCMRIHYQEVVRQNDHITKPSLTEVLNMIGFTDDELRQLYIEATMREEDNAPDFKPDLTLLQSEIRVDPQQVAHPAECQCPSCVNINMIPHDQDGQPLQPDEDEPSGQMSMF
jgi:hypothetical protein